MGAKHTIQASRALYPIVISHRVLSQIVVEHVLKVIDPLGETYPPSFV